MSRADRAPGAGRFGGWWIALAATVLGLLMVMPLPGHARAMAALANLAHAPAFGLLAWLVWSTLARRWPQATARAAVVSWLLVVGFGVVMEGVQGRTGRSASVADVVADGLGAAAFLVVGQAAGWSVPGRWLAGIAALALLAVPSVGPVATLLDMLRQREAVPVLASFERPGELERWEFAGARAARVPDHAGDGRWGLRVDFEPGQVNSVALVWPWPNWIDYRFLTFRAVLGGPGPLPLWLGIEDAATDGTAEDRAERTLVLSPGSNTVRIALRDVMVMPSGRLLDLMRIRRVQLWTEPLATPRTVHFDDFRLEGPLGEPQR